VLGLGGRGEGGLGGGGYGEATNGGDGRDVEIDVLAWEMTEGDLLEEWVLV
jgi:hypothetical protein